MRRSDLKLWSIFLLLFQFGLMGCTMLGLGDDEEESDESSETDSSSTTGTSASSFIQSSSLSLVGSMSTTSTTASLVKAESTDYWFKCVTLSVTDETACINQVVDSEFNLTCPSSFSGAFGCFILTGEDATNLSIAGVVTSSDFNLDPNSTNAEMEIVFDPETGAVQVKAFNQYAKKVDGSKVEIETEAIEREVDPALIDALDGKISSGDYDLTMCFPPPPNFKLVDAGGPFDGDNIKDACGDHGGMTRVAYLKYTKGDVAEKRFPRLELWSSRQDFNKCVVDGKLRYHLSDGTNEFIPEATSFNALDLVDEIIDNKWAPDFALKFYELSQDPTMVQSVDKMEKEREFVTALFEFYGIENDKENLKELADTLAIEFFKAFDKAKTVSDGNKTKCVEESIMEAFEKVNIPSWLMEDDDKGEYKLVTADGEGDKGDDPIYLCGPYRGAKANGATSDTLQGMIDEFSMWIVKELGRDPMEREKAEAGLRLVDSFLHAIGESRHQQHSGDDFNKEFREAWNALDQDNLASTSEEALVAFTFAWADFIQMWDWTFPEQLRLAANNYDTAMFACDEAYLVKNKYYMDDEYMHHDDMYYGAEDDFDDHADDDTYKGGHYCPPPPPGFTEATTGKEFILGSLADKERLKMIQEKLCDNDWNFDFVPVADIIRPFVAENFQFKNHNITWVAKKSTETEAAAGIRRLKAAKALVLKLIQSEKLHGCQLTHLKQDYDRLDRMEFYWDHTMGGHGPQDFVDCGQAFNHDKPECSGTNDDDQFCKWNPMDPQCFDENNIDDHVFHNCQWDLFGLGVEKHDMCMKWAMYGYNDVPAEDTFCYGGSDSINYNTPECQFYNHACHLPANQDKLECACLPGSPNHKPECFEHECTKDPNLPHCAADFDPSETAALVASYGGPGMPEGFDSFNKENKNAYQWAMERGWQLMEGYRSTELQSILEKLIAGEFTKDTLIKALNKYMRMSGWDHMKWMIEEIKKRGPEVAQRFLTEEVARESFRTDVAYRAKMKTIVSNSECLFDAGISWESREFDDDGNEVFPAVIRAPVKREFAGELEFDKDSSGDDVDDMFRLDAARLNFQKSCYWGEVQRLYNLEFTDDGFKSKYERGFVDTCRDQQDSKGDDDGGSKLVASEEGEEEGKGGGGGHIEKLKIIDKD